ncbi:MAG: alpha/beta hydrolase [Ornithinimicrobium sp.]
MPTLSTRHARLSYDITGEGPLAVQLHGLTSSRARDALLGLDLCRCLRSCRVLRYDARGHGHSTGRRISSDYGWPALAADVLALLDHEAPGQLAHGVGQSMGSATLLHAAIAAPDRFSTLVLGIPPTAWSSRAPQRTAYRHSADLIERSGLDQFMDRAHRAPRPPAVCPDAPVTAPDVAPSLLPTVFRGAADTDLPSPEDICTIAAPTLLLSWVNDPAHPESSAQHLHELLPNSHLVVARTPKDVARWPGLVAEHLAARPAVN